MSIGEPPKPPPLCEICGEEMIQVGPKEWECTRLDLHKPAYKSWLGKVSKHVTSSLIFQGKQLMTSKVKCRCESTINVDKQVDFHAGSRLSLAVKNMEDYAGWRIKNVKLQEKARKGDLTLGAYIQEQEKLNVEYARSEGRFGSRSFRARGISIICDNCGATLGSASVTVSLINLPEVPFLTRREINNLPISPKMLARISKDLRYDSVLQLERYVKAEGLQEAKKIISEYKEKLDGLTLPYDIIRLFNPASAVEAIDREIKRRRKELVDAAIKIAKERVKVIR